jgi:iron complex outermembrane receptor protein
MEEYSYGTDNIKEMQRYGDGEITATPQKNYNLDIQKTWENIGKHTITAGVNWRTEQYDRDVYLSNKWNDKNSISRHEGTEHGGKTDLKSIFIQDEYGINDELTMYLGARLDQYKNSDYYQDFI